MPLSLCHAFAGLFQCFFIPRHRSTSPTPSPSPSRSPPRTSSPRHTVPAAARAVLCPPAAWRRQAASPEATPEAGTSRRRTIGVQRVYHPPTWRRRSIGGGDADCSETQGALEADEESVMCFKTSRRREHRRQKQSHNQGQHQDESPQESEHCSARHSRRCVPRSVRVPRGESHPSARERRSSSSPPSPAATSRHSPYADTHRSTEGYRLRRRKQARAAARRGKSRDTSGTARKGANSLEEGGHAASRRRKIGTFKEEVRESMDEVEMCGGSHCLRHVASAPAAVMSKRIGRQQTNAADKFRTQHRSRIRTFDTRSHVFAMELLRGAGRALENQSRAKQMAAKAPHTSSPCSYGGSSSPIGRATLAAAPSPQSRFGIGQSNARSQHRLQKSPNLRVSPALEGCNFAPEAKRIVCQDELTKRTEREKITESQQDRAVGLKGPATVAPTPSPPPMMLPPPPLLPPSPLPPCLLPSPPPPAFRPSPPPLLTGLRERRALPPPPPSPSPPDGASPLSCRKVVLDPSSPVTSPVFVLRSTVIPSPPVANLDVPNLKPPESTKQQAKTKSSVHSSSSSSFSIKSDAANPQTSEKILKEEPSPATPSIMFLQSTRLSSPGSTKSKSPKPPTPQKADKRESPLVKSPSMVSPSARNQSPQASKSSFLSSPESECEEEILNDSSPDSSLHCIQLSPHRNTSKESSKGSPLPGGHLQEPCTAPSPSPTTLNLQLARLKSPPIVSTTSPKCSPEPSGHREVPCTTQSPTTLNSKESSKGSPLPGGHLQELCTTLSPSPTTLNLQLARLKSPSVASTKSSKGSPLPGEHLQEPCTTPSPSPTTLNLQLARLKSPSVASTKSSVQSSPASSKAGGPSLVRSPISSLFPPRQSLSSSTKSKSSKPSSPASSNLEVISPARSPMNFLESAQQSPSNSTKSKSSKPSTPASPHQGVISPVKSPLSRKSSSIKSKSSKSSLSPGLKRQALSPAVSPLDVTKVGRIQTPPLLNTKKNENTPCGGSSSKVDIFDSSSWSPKHTTPDNKESDQVLDLDSTAALSVGGGSQLDYRYNPQPYWTEENRETDDGKCRRKDDVYIVEDLDYPTSSTKPLQTPTQSPCTSGMFPTHQSAPKYEEVPPPSYNYNTYGHYSTYNNNYSSTYGDSQRYNQHEAYGYHDPYAYNRHYGYNQYGYVESPSYVEPQRYDHAVKHADMYSAYNHGNGYSTYNEPQTFNGAQKSSEIPSYTEVIPFNEPFKSPNDDVKKDPCKQSESTEIPMDTDSPRKSNDASTKNSQPVEHKSDITKPQTNESGKKLIIEDFDATSSEDDKAVADDVRSSVRTTQGGGGGDRPFGAVFGLVRAANKRSEGSGCSWDEMTSEESESIGDFL